MGTSLPPCMAAIYSDTYSRRTLSWTVPDAAMAVAAIQMSGHLASSTLLHGD